MGIYELDISWAATATSCADCTGPWSPASGCGASSRPPVPAPSPSCWTATGPASSPGRERSSPGWRRHCHDSTSPRTQTNATTPKGAFEMKRFSPRLFALGLALGALGATAVLAINAYASTGRASAAPVAPRRAPGIRRAGDRLEPGAALDREHAGRCSRRPSSRRGTSPSFMPRSTTRSTRSTAPRAVPDLRPGAPRRSETAAADAAAHTALVGLYPAQQSVLDAAMRPSSRRCRMARPRTRVSGRRVGRRAICSRSAPATDRTSRRATVRRRARTRATTADAAEPPGTGLHDVGQVTPFVLDRGDQFRPAPPPALTQDAYAAALNEVKSLGSAASTTRTADQTRSANSGPRRSRTSGTDRPARRASPHSDLSTTARLFAALNISFADSVIAFYQAKYAYRLWRPVMAIRLADTDGNAATTADPAWLPLSVNTGPTRPTPVRTARSARRPRPYWRASTATANASPSTRRHCRA